MHEYSDYWAYYRSDFDWPNDVLKPNITATRQIYADLGISVEEGEALITSGYVNLRGDTIIDRYHGGALLSPDGSTRIHKHQFLDWYSAVKGGSAQIRSKAIVTTATSLSDLEAQVQQLQADLGGRLVFRGQTKHHKLSRPVENPFLAVDGFGEVSLIPSLWRKQMMSKPQSFHNFKGMDGQEWRKIISSQFDIEEITRRVRERISRGELIHSFQDMEDSDDPVLNDFGRVGLDLLMGANLNLADLLNTLLQHYGLLSPYLDLSSDLGVALFFASHQFTTQSGMSSYRYVGTNNGQSVMYVFRHNQTEMADYAWDRALHNLEPLRPKRQACVICRSAPYALNLAAIYLRAVIRLDFELPGSERRVVEDIFPSVEEDSFLAALISNCAHPAQATRF